MPAFLDRIRKRANAIRRDTGMSYRDALKAAGKEYREGKIHGSVPRRSQHRPGRKVFGSGVVTVGHRMAGLTQQLEMTRDQVHQQLGWLLAAQRTAKTKKEKRELMPRIRKLEKLLKALEA